MNTLQTVEKIFDYYAFKHAWEDVREAYSLDTIRIALRQNGILPPAALQYVQDFKRWIDRMGFGIFVNHRPAPWLAVAVLLAQPFYRKNLPTFHLKAVGPGMKTRGRADTLFVE